MQVGDCSGRRSDEVHDLYIGLMGCSLLMGMHQLARISDYGLDKEMHVD